MHQPSGEPRDIQPRRETAQMPLKSAASALSNVSSDYSRPSSFSPVSPPVSSPVSPPGSRPAFAVGAPRDSVGASTVQQADTQQIHLVRIVGQMPSGDQMSDYLRNSALLHPPPINVPCQSRRARAHHRFHLWLSIRDIHLLRDSAPRIRPLMPVSRPSPNLALCTRHSEGWFPLSIFISPPQQARPLNSNSSRHHRRSHHSAFRRATHTPLIGPTISEP